MNKRDREYFRNLILEKREGLLKELGYLENEVLTSTSKDSSGDLSAYSFHMADQGTDAEEREKAFLLASREGRYVYHLNEALRRIADGSYGKCELCGKQISKERLEAVPHATKCIACKSKEETP
jgi:RNA polymerase-binding protein DksA